ncbi:MAG: hypothetical protein MZV63_13650 [Marinilabiliales bacterium]|nr:hypothetical protein [Marinilabiliales bacterium]
MLKEKGLDAVSPRTSAGIVRYGGYNHIDRPGDARRHRPVRRSGRGPGAGVRLRLRHPAVPPRRGDRHPDRGHGRHHGERLREPVSRRAADGRRDRGPDEEGRDPPDSSKKSGCMLRRERT